MSLTPQLLHILSYPLTPDMQRYVSNLPARFPNKFKHDDLVRFNLAVQNSKVMNGKAHSH